MCEYAHAHRHVQKLVEGGRRSQNIIEGPLLGVSEEDTHQRHLLVCMVKIGNRENSGMSLYCCKDQDEKSMVLRRSRAQPCVNMDTDGRKI